MNIFGYLNLCHSVVASTMQDVTELIEHIKTRVQEDGWGLDTPEI